MIAVTATDHNDDRTFSGYGVTTIDLGAPGEDVFTTSSNGNYTTTSGTSFASPLVAGVIALMYSAPCNQIANLSLSDPQNAAQKVRDFLFEGVDPVAGLANETVYGGRVNAYNSLQLLLDDCECNSDEIITTTYSSGNTIDIEASNSITASNIIESGATVDYDAGNFVLLIPGFQANDGSVFSAFIDGCDGLYKIEQESDPYAIREQINIKNYPNPFTGTTTIEFTLKNDSPVTLFISDATGRQIAKLLTGEQQTTGTHQVTFDGNPYPAGMYYYTIQAGEYVGVQKMVLVK